MYQPEATYRIQFHKDFTFKHLKDIIPYLDRLGIKTIYASPVFKAVAGSGHGYDGTDPNSINPEIGTLEELREIAMLLQQRGMGWLQDFVPNHMAFSPQNAWLCDFLEKGKTSAYDAFFDKNPDEPLMAPFLGTTLQEALANETLTLVFSDGRLRFRYFETEYPLNYTAYYDIIGHERFDAFPFSSLRAKLDILSEVTVKQDFDNHWEAMLHELNQVIKEESVLKMFREGIGELSRNPLLMARLAGQQFYRLCCWKETGSRINYRRFFTINSLICMQMQLPEVFEAYHRLLLQLISDGIIQGVRIDHIDGLYDPAAYLEQLRNHTGEDVYIVVEKILARDEQLPRRWPVQGSTGYDFLAQVNQVLTQTSSEAVFSDFYQSLDEDPATIASRTSHYKQKILQEQMQGELANLLAAFLAIPGLDLPEEISHEALREVIAAVLIYCPVYRFYPNALPLTEQEAYAFSGLVAVVAEQAGVSEDALRFFRDCLTLMPRQKEELFNQALLHFWRRCMQLSGPLMAKGVEDTLMYNYHRFLAHNEVGNDPGSFGITVDRFHELMQERGERFPLALNATATHDTKRGEDSRARLQWLSAVPQAWFSVAEQCMNVTGNAPGHLSARDKYFLIQAVYGALPLGHDPAPSLETRLRAYLQKAAREAKEHSDWAAPDEGYEEGLFLYALTLADPRQQPGKALYRFQETQRNAIAARTLAQLVLKLTCPGVPDIYQGTEWYDLSFVDPDNRSPVNYEARKMMLETFAAEHFDPMTLPQHPDSPALKMYTLYKLLQLRKAVPDLFAKGSYEPLTIHDDCLSFIRGYRDEVVCVIIPMVAVEDNQLTTKVAQHPALQGKWQDVFTEQLLPDHTGASMHWPVTVLRKMPRDADRDAGILMPLFSLPSDYGIGGMGKEARSFIDFLFRAGQRIWQLLPLNPLLVENSFSPYASSSAFAGEPVYIDLEQLMAEGLLEVQDIQEAELPSLDQVSYEQVTATKASLFRKAWTKFQEDDAAALHRDFDVFRASEKGWLEDYVLFVVIRQQQGRPWYEWPVALRDREPQALASVWSQESDALAYQQFLQYLFHRQWHSLRAFAAQRNVQLMGDVPFYVSHDSADVWSHPHLFTLDTEGGMMHVAGVPPDYFSATGQLWGMPTYDWVASQQQGYTWWLNRLRKNISLYDFVRLDHFRAFYDYWEIPAGAATAVDGCWRKGPQDDLFLLLQQQFPGMPFIAEDLGEIHRGVFDFKDRFRLPGMRVLQFGFSDYDGSRRDLPHNCTPLSIVYTGTHDNDTIAGWYVELGDSDREALSAYAGHEVTAANVAELMCRMAYASVAKTAIILIQDLLGLDHKSRINTPATTKHNWLWRLLPQQLDEELAANLMVLMTRYHR